MRFQDKLDLLQSLNINSIEFMPWIAWPDDATFSWGYDPAYFFSVESAYVTDPGNPLNRLSKLADLITECHRIIRSKGNAVRSGSGSHRLGLDHTLPRVPFQRNP